MSSVCMAKKKNTKTRDHIHCCFACMPLLSSVNDRDVRKMGPSAYTKQTEQKKKKKEFHHQPFFFFQPISLHHPIMPASYKQHANRHHISTSCIRSHPSTIINSVLRFLSVERRKKEMNLLFLFSLPFTVG